MDNKDITFVTNSAGDYFSPELTGDFFKKHPSDVVFRDHYPELYQAEDALFFIVGTDSGLLFKTFIQRAQLKDWPVGLVLVFVERQTIIEAIPILKENENLLKGAVRLVNEQFDLREFSQEFNSYVVRRKIAVRPSFSAKYANDTFNYKALIHNVNELVSSWSYKLGASFYNAPFEQQRMLNIADNRFRAE